MSTIFKVRRGTSDEWAARLIPLADGEPGLDETLNIVKMGNGVTMWADLDPFMDKDTVQQMINDSVGGDISQQITDQINATVPELINTAVPPVVDAAVATAVPTEVAAEVPGAVATAIDASVPNAVAAEVAAELPGAVNTAVTTVLPTLVANEVANEVPTAVNTAVTSAITTAVPPAVAASVATAVPPAVADAVPTVLFQEDFARCTLGVQPDATTTTYDNTIGDSGDETAGGVVLTTIADTLFGNQCAQFTVPSVVTNTYGFLGKVVSALDTGVMYFERYYKVSARPGFRTSILLWKNTLLGGTHLGSFAIGGSANNYKFVLVNVDTNVTSSTHDVPIGQWFRVRVKLDTINHVQTAALFLGNNVFGSSPDETITGAIGTTTLGYFEDGIVTNPNLAGFNIQLSHPRNSNLVLPNASPGPVGPAGAAGSSGVPNAITFQEDFARCTLGVQPNAATTSYANTIGDTGDETSGGVTLTTVAETLFNGLCAQFSVATAGPGIFGFLGSPIASPANGVTYFERFYKVASRPSFRTSVMLWKTALLAGTHLGSFGIGGSANNYKFTLVNVDTVAVASTNDVPIGTWFRVRVKLDTINLTQTAELFLGANVFGLNPDETISAAIGASTLGYFEDGIATNPGTNGWSIQISRPRNGNYSMSPPPKPGPQGATGATGTAGTNGTNGTNGAAGATGATGSPGVIVLQHTDPDPSTPLSGVLYVRLTS